MIDDSCHLYSVSSDENNIYMELNDMSECCFELWELCDGTRNSMVKVKIPLSSWKKIKKQIKKKNK